MGAESPHILGRDRTRGLSGRDNRLVVGGSLDRAAGLTVARSSGGVRRLEVCRFSRWRHKGIWHAIFDALSDDPTSNIRSWIPRSSALISTQRAPKRSLKIRPSSAPAAG